PHEAPLTLRVRRLFGQYDFDRNLTLQGFVLAAIDHAHATFTQLLDDAIAGNALRNGSIMRPADGYLEGRRIQKTGFLSCSEQALHFRPRDGIRGTLIVQELHPLPGGQAPGLFEQLFDPRPVFGTELDHLLISAWSQARATSHS